MSNMLRGSLTSTTDAKGVLGFKGERGYSAYEIAVKNGYQGTEQEWIDHFGLDLTDYVKTSDILDLVYPVGSLYMSVNSTSPATLFGGTWEQIKDKFLLSAGDTYNAGDTGGEATHTLTTSELPQITGSFSTSDNVLVNTLPSNTIATATGVFTRGVRNQTQVSSATSSVAEGQGVQNSINMSFGANQPHNNMPPYLVVYVWKRIQ